MSGLSWSTTATGEHKDEPAQHQTAAHAQQQEMGLHNLPKPTIWPATLAAGIALIAGGLTTSPFVLAGGAVLFVLALRGWVLDLLGDLSDGRRRSEADEQEGDRPIGLRTPDSAADDSHA